MSLRIGRRRGLRHGAACGALFGFLAIGAGAVQEGQDPEPGEASEPIPADTSPYLFLDDRDELLSSWMGSGLAERIQLGTSAGGNELFAVQFGAAGTQELRERTTILLLGGLDGVSICGSEAVIAITSSLLANPERLPQNVTFVAVPWANPDGLASWLSDGCGAGRNAQPFDDDRDLEVDEDPPDDIDSDGVVLDMLLEDPQGPWVRSSDPRFLRPAREGEAPRYVLLREGRDDDGDGRYNEDPVGGVALDLNFPVGWEGHWGGRPTGPWPLSEPAAKAIADFALARRTALVLVFQGNHGLLATPGGTVPGDGALALPFEQDLPTYSQLVELFARTSARKQDVPLRLVDARGDARPGAAIDWFYAALGALSMEVAVWGPDVEDDVRATVDAQYVRGRDEQGDSTGQGVEDPSAEDQAWARWLDDTRGGLGFVDWHPVDLGDGRQGLVGGWRPQTCFNPPAEVLQITLNGLDAFALQLAKSLPALEVEVLERSRDGRVVLLRARVDNGGGLPSGVGPVGPDRGVRLRLELPREGVELLAGELVQELGHLPGNGTSEEFSWIVVAPPDSVFRFVVESPWAPEVTEVVRL